MAADNKATAAILLVIVYCATVVFFLPGTMLATVTTGLLFDFALGSFIMWIGGIIAQTIGFLLSRYMFRRAVLRAVRRFSSWKALDGAVAEEGFKVAMLLRAPGMPYNLLNWLFGATEIKFWVYSVASAIGIIPKTLLYVYFGETLGNVIEVLQRSRKATTDEVIQLSVMVPLVFVSMVLIIYFVRRRLKQKLREMEEEEQQQQQEEEEEQESEPEDEEARGSSRDGGAQGRGDGDAGARHDGKGDDTTCKPADPAPAEDAPGKRLSLPHISSASEIPVGNLSVDDIEAQAASNPAEQQGNPIRGRRSL